MATTAPINFDVDYLRTQVIATNPFKVSFQPLSNLAVDTWGCLEF
jgi:hypothetical protein